MKPNAVTLILMATATFVFATPRHATACDCINPGPPCRAVPAAAAVFVGRVASLSATGVAVLSVERHVRGTRASSITMARRGTNCDYTFTVGERYVVYAYQNEAGALETSICTGTKPLDQAREDLAYFDELLRPSSGAHVYGRFRYMDRDFETGRSVDRGPVTGRTITLSGGRSPIVTRTDGDGRFDIRGLPVGAYELHLNIPDRYFWTPVKLQLNHERACEALDSVIQLDGRISGQLLDADGRPEGGVQLEIAAASTKGARTRPLVKYATTTPDGRFEFRPLPPGNYVIGTELSKPLIGNQPDRRRYFAGQDGSDGTIRLEAGGSIQLRPFQLPPLPRNR